MNADEYAAMVAKFEERHGKVKRRKMKPRVLKPPPESAESQVMEALCRCSAGAQVQREWAFHPDRKWRFDFAWAAVKLALEIEGRGRHQTVIGVLNDCEKYNRALVMGWRVLRFPATHVGNPVYLQGLIQLVLEALDSRSGV